MSAAMSAAARVLAFGPDYKTLLCGGGALSPRKSREGEAPAEPFGATIPRLGRSFALPVNPKSQVSLCTSVSEPKRNYP